MFSLTDVSYSRRISATDLPALDIDSLIVGSRIGEERGRAVRALLDGAHYESLVSVDRESGRMTAESSGMDFSLYEASEIQDFVASISGRIGIDITSLEHRVWAPLVRAILEADRDAVALYVEPDDYEKSSEPLPGAVYDLSLSRGIEPLPGFARVSTRAGDLGDFAPLLGFEGARLLHVLDQEDVDASRTHPIVGFPGFRMEYTSYSILANRDALESDYLHQRIEYARASCPFEAYSAIERVYNQAEGEFLRVAPLGTKPHALGAVLFALAHPQTVELIYDHPVPSDNRTSGSASIHLYEFTDFVKSR